MGYDYNVYNTKVKDFCQRIFSPDTFHDMDVLSKYLSFRDFSHIHLTLLFMGYDYIVHDTNMKDFCPRVWSPDTFHDMDVFSKYLSIGGFSQISWSRFMMGHNCPVYNASMKDFCLRIFFQRQISWHKCGIKISIIRRFLAYCF